MEFQKITNFLDTTLDDKDLPRFVTKKWIEVHDQSGGNYNVNKEIRIKTPMLRSDLCDYSDAYIVMKGNIIVDKKHLLLMILMHPIIQQPMQPLLILRMIMRLVKKLVFRNNALFINCISKINGVKIDNAEDLHVVIPMYNLLEYSKNYRKTTGRLCIYYRGEANSGVNGGINYSIMDSKSFDYKVNFIKNGVTQGNLTKNGVKIVVPLTYLSNFWRSLNIPLINCEIELILTWFTNCVLISKATREANDGTNSVVQKIDNPENAILEITDTKLYVPVVTLSKENDAKLLEQLKKGFKRMNYSFKR